MNVHRSRRRTLSRRFSAHPHGQDQGREAEKSSRESHPTTDTTQAERAAMHPERHDLEWGYYFTAWSH